MINGVVFTGSQLRISYDNGDVYEGTLKFVGGRFTIELPDFVVADLTSIPVTSELYDSMRWITNLITASDMPYDSSSSGLLATDVAGAIDEIIAGLDGILQFQGDISAASDFPTSTDVKTGWLYRVLADVTDDDPTKTNTGQSFVNGAEIFWAGVWVSTGVPLPINLVLTDEASLVDDEILLGGGDKKVKNSGEKLSDYIKDAPSDGKTYGRKDAAWEEVSTGGAGIDEYGSLSLSKSLPFNDSSIVGPAVLQWQGMAASETGQHVSATAMSGRIYTSSDYGQTFTPRDSDRGWRGISMSADGQHQLAAELSSSGKLYRSTNYGVTWSAVSGSTDRMWLDTGISNNGQYQIGVSYHSAPFRPAIALLSSDYGATFNPIASLADLTYGVVEVSATGQYMVASGVTGEIIYSDDYGATWNQILQIPSGYFQGLAMSSDGQIITGGVDGHGIWITYNGGKNWKETPIYRKWFDFSMSYDGRFQIGCSADSSRTVIFSSEYGRAWKEITGVTLPMGEEWTRVTNAGNGKLIIAGMYKTGTQSRLYRTIDWLAGDLGEVISDQSLVTARDIRFGTTALRPTDKYITMNYFDSDLGYMIWWDGVNWVDATGTIV